jgi:hypothetical protein
MSDDAWRAKWWHFGAPWAWPTFTIRRQAPHGWVYSYKSRRSAGHGASALFRDALRISVGCALGRRWGWRPGWSPNFDNMPMEHDDWSIHLECGHIITRTYMHPPTLDRLPTDIDGEPKAYCPEHGFESVWFTSGVLDPSPWYEGEPGFREFGWRRPVPS